MVGVPRSRAGILDVKTLKFGEMYPLGNLVTVYIDWPAAQMWRKALIEQEELKQIVTLVRAAAAPSVRFRIEPLH